MNVGFIGTGAITTALVTGICTAEHRISGIWVSPRNRDRSAFLQQKFAQVTVGTSNQNVIDRCDVVFLAFLPKDAEEVLNAVNFTRDHLIITLLSGTNNSRIAELVNVGCEVCRAVPLPCSAEHVGPIVIYPGHDKAAELFDLLGTVITAQQEEHLEYLSVITALMAPFFEMVGHITDWAVDAGVEQKLAADYTASMYEALSVLAQNYETGDMYQLADESMTPGGLNELARKIINESGGYDYLKPVLSSVSSRVLNRKK